MGNGAAVQKSKKCTCEACCCKTPECKASCSHSLLPSKKPRLPLPWTPRAILKLNREEKQLEGEVKKLWCNEQAERQQDQNEDYSSFKASMPTLLSSIKNASRQDKRAIFGLPISFSKYSQKKRAERKDSGSLPTLLACRGEQATGSAAATLSGKDRRKLYGASKSRSWDVENESTVNDKRKLYGSTKSRSLGSLPVLQDDGKFSYDEQVHAENVLGLGNMKFYRHTHCDNPQVPHDRNLRNVSVRFPQVRFPHDKRAACAASTSNSLPKPDDTQQCQYEGFKALKRSHSKICEELRRKRSLWSRIENPTSQGTSKSISFSNRKRVASCPQLPKA